MTEGYGLYIAKIVGDGTVNDNRLKVQVLPYMEGISDSDCPAWPYFFRGQALTGKAGEFVWVVCSDDFTIGYILGTANYTTYIDDDYSKRSSYSILGSRRDLNLSIPSDLITTVNEYIKEQDVDATINLANVHVTFWNDNCIHMLERNSGGKIIAYSNGTFYIMRSNMLLVVLEGVTGIKLSKNGISMFGPAINLQSDDIGLGTEPSGSILVTAGSDTTIGQASTSARA